MSALIIVVLYGIRGKRQKGLDAGIQTKLDH